MSTVVTTRQAAKQLHVSVPTVIRMFNKGTLTGYKLNPDARNSPIRIHQASIDQLLQQRQHT